jgi:hypothetical protein
MGSSSYKFENRVGTVASAEDAINSLIDLGNECREIVDNASEGLAQTQRIQTLDEVAGTLENLDTPDLPECVRDLGISYQEQVWRRKRGGPSRNARRSNETAVLFAVVGALEEWLDDEANAEHDDRDEVESAKDELQNIAEEADGCEFPGMYG